MSDGLVAVYSLLDGLPVDGEAYLCSHTLNKTMFGLKDSDPRQKPYAVRSMVLVGCGSQVSSEGAPPSTPVASPPNEAPPPAPLSCGSLTVLVCWFSTVGVSTRSGGWSHTRPRPPSYP